MSTSPTVPIFDPQGQLRDVPYEQMHAAVAGGGVPSVRFRDPQGNVRFVPANRTQEAVKSGGTVLPIEQQDMSHPGLWASLGSDLGGMAKGLWHGAVDPLSETHADLVNKFHQEQVSDAAAENSSERNAHGAIYKNVIVPAATAIGVNVPGMEQSAAEGDVLGVYGHAAAPAVVAAGTSALIHGVSAANEAMATSPSASAATGAVPDAFSAALKKIPQAAIQRVPWLGDVLTDVYKAGSKAFAEAKGPGAPGYERYAPNTGATSAGNAAQVQSPGPYPEAAPAQPELDATGENKAFAGGLDEPAPQKILDATGENKAFAGGMDEAAPKTILPAEPPMLQAQPAQATPRIAADIANWQPPPELGVTSAPDYGAAARADVERRMGGALPRGMAERRIISPIEEAPDENGVSKEEWDTARFIEPQVEGTPRGDLTKQLQDSLDQVNARKAPQSVGSASAAEQDTASFRQARAELGQDAPLSKVAQRAQEIKTQKIRSIQ